MFVYVFLKISIFFKQTDCFVFLSRSITFDAANTFERLTTTILWITRFCAEIALKLR